MTETAETARAKRSKIAFSLLAVYLIWGSTYLGLRFALESFPPFLLGAARYTLAGLAMLAYARRSGEAWPTGGEWGRAVILGALLFAVGNGLVGVAEHTISTGVASIVVATVAPWQVLFAALWGARPRPVELLGVLFGMLGVAVLHLGGAFDGSLGGLIAIAIAPIGFALGAVLSGRMRQPPGAMAAAVQMIGGGLVMATLGLLLEERIGSLTVSACVAFAYLLVFGSFVAFAAFRYLLLNARPALASSYAFVNPLIALLLGALVMGEPLTPLHLGACLLTGVAVVCILRGRRS